MVKIIKMIKNVTLLYLILMMTRVPLAYSGLCPLKLNQANLCAKLEWIDGPHLEKKSTFNLTFWDQDDESETSISLQQNLKLHVFSWMTMNSGHHHGGPKMTWKEVGQGKYQVSDARFFMQGMNGFWEIKIQLSEGNQVIDQAAYRVNFLQ